MFGYCDPNTGIDQSGLARVVYLLFYKALSKQGYSPTIERGMYLICIITFFLAAQTLTIKSTPSGPTYVQLGENLTLDVTYTYTGSRGVNVEWSKNNTALVRKFDDGSIVSFDKRASVKGEASFVLTNIELNDNGDICSHR